MVCLKEGGITVRRPLIRQPYSTEFVSACEVWIEVRIGAAINRSTILRKQQCFRYQRVPRCVLGDFCGRFDLAISVVSFQLLRGHVEDLLLHTCIFPVLKWEQRG